MPIKNKIKILTVIGARPQFIKASVLSRMIRETNDFTEIIVHTGQHFDKNMSEIFFEEMEIALPDYNLNINGLLHGAMTGQMMEKIEEIIVKEKPEWVLVYGDTNSTLAGALAAKKLKVKVAHVEAGLRSYNTEMPEEINRILTDRISDILFCPTVIAEKNLLGEGFKNFSCKIVNCGDIMLDAANFYKEKLGNQLTTELQKKFQFNEFVLATIHRAENTDNKTNLEEIFEGMQVIGENIILPLHPRTLTSITKNKIFIPENIHIIDPVGYLEMLELESNCKYIITDSGGVQKEAYFFKKPCFTVRTETEWIETVESGWNIITGPNKNKLCEAILNFTEPSEHPHFYGNGQTGYQILETFRYL